MDLSIFKNAVESSINAIGITDLEGKLIYVNDSCVKMWGYNSKDEVLGRFLPEFWEGDGVLKTVKELREKGAASGEDIGKRKDGSLFFVQFTASIFTDEADNPSFMFGSFFDITERKQAEEELRESEERFKMIFTNSSDGIIVADPETKKFLYVNPAICKILGYTEEELTQMGVTDIHPKNQLEHVTAEFEAQARGEKLLAMNLPFLKKNGEIIYMDTNASIVIMGKKSGLMGVFRDITDRKLAEDALKKAHDKLERRVKERTRELEIKTKGLEEINTAMTIILKKREEDKIELEDNVLTNVKELVEPYFEKIKKTKLDDQQEAFFSIIESNLKEIISPFTRKISLKYLNLTPTEIRIANLIRHGSPSKKIAELMNVSPRTIDAHRKNIRRKIGLQGQRGNLRSHLLSLY